MLPLKQMTFKAIQHALPAANYLPFTEG